jgi:hypothetical protein
MQVHREATQNALAALSPLSSLALPRTTSHPIFAFAIAAL